jgi:hypothetical protein
MQTAPSKLNQKPLAGAKSLAKNGSNSSPHKNKSSQPARSSLPHTYVHTAQQARTRHSEFSRASLVSRQALQKKMGYLQEKINGEK